MSKRTVVILFLGVVLLAVYIAYELKPSTSTSAETINLDEIEALGIMEILESIYEPEKVTLLHAYGYNPTCPNCDEEAIMTELLKVNRFNDHLGDELNLIPFNVFDYSEQEIGLLQNVIRLAQTPTTFLLDKQGRVVFEQVGSVSEVELENAMRELLTND